MQYYYVYAYSTTSGWLEREEGREKERRREREMYSTPTASNSKSQLGYIILSLKENQKARELILYIVLYYRAYRGNVGN